MVFNATFNNISVISLWLILLVEETGGLVENHRPIASHWHVVHLALIEIPTHTISGDRHWLQGTDCIGSCKSNYHMITAKILQKQKSNIAYDID